MEPAEAYYRKNAGRWRGSVSFALVDRVAFAATRMSFFDRVRLWSMRLLSSLGPLTMRTSVEIVSATVVVHTTRLSKWGMPLLVGREVLTLAPDGVSATMACEHRLGPTWGLVRFAGEVRVADDARRAEYVLGPWFGTTLRQTGSIEGDTVRLVQETVFSRSEQVLRRA